MTDVDLNFIAERLLAIQTDMRDIKTAVTDLADGQTVLGQMILRLERDMVRVKDILGRMDSRIADLEKAAK
jgi:hypothetical protein